MRSVARCAALLGTLLSFLALVYCLLGSLANYFATARQRAYAAGCRRNLEQIGRAVEVYTTRYHVLPPSLEALARGAPSIQFQSYCMVVEPETAVFDFEYVWDPSSSEVCRDAAPHVIRSVPIRYQVNFLTASGEVRSHVRHSFPPLLMDALMLFLLALGITCVWLFRRTGSRRRNEH